MSQTESSWMISVIEIGNLISPIPAGILADRWGRKPCILATGPLFFITWMIVLTTNTVEALYLVRILQGTIMGFMFTLIPVYLAEIASPKIRGSIVSTFQIAWYFGYLFEYSVGPFVSYKTFTAITAVWPILLTILFCWQPESPYYLLMRGRNQEAIKSLSVLRMMSVTHQEVLDEFEEIRTSLKKKEEKSSWTNLLTSKTDRDNLCVVFFVSLVTMLSGGYAVMSYSSHIFTSTQANTAFLEPDHITIFIGVFLFLSSFFSSAFVDRLGRRPLLLISTVGCTISLFFATTYFYFLEINTPGISHYSWVLFICIVFYFIFWAFGLVPVYMTYQSELFSSSSRGTASSIIAVVVTVYAFVNLKSYFPITEKFGFCTLFGVYTTVCFIGIIGIYLIAPETKGKSLSEIQNGNKKTVFTNDQELRSSLLAL